MVNLELKVPDSFLDEEIRNGFTVTRERKEIWAVELDLLNKLDQVCKKHNIKYCADGGTLLGAVRHNGFIPWDDDIDIAMLRSEYEKLCSIATEEFKFPYFWQTEETDPTSARGHAQLRNSNTTGILLSERGSGRMFNQGIFIDIFPFDDIQEDSSEYYSQFENVSKLRNRTYDVLNRVNFYKGTKEIFHGKRFSFLHQLKHRILHSYYLIKHSDYRTIFDKFIAECKKYDNGNDHTMVADLCIPISPSRIKRYKEDFYDLFEMPFEFVTIPVFRKYDRNLKLLYGNNYMIPIHSDNVHAGVFFNVNKSYKEYLQDSGKYYEKNNSNNNRRRIWP